MAKILIVDDEEDMRFTLSVIISEKGHAIHEASSAKDAFQKLEKEKYDLIIMDIRMPDIDGLQALKGIRERGYDTPVMMVTGYQNIESAVDAVRLGASEIIKKPFDNQYLIATINKVLERRNEPKQNGSFEKQVEEKFKTSRLKEDAVAVELKTSAKKNVSEVKNVSLDNSVAKHNDPSFPLIADRKKINIWKNKWTFIFIVFVVLSGFGASMKFFFWQKIISLKTPRSMNLPFKNVSAIHWYKDELWIADWYTHGIYQTKIKEGEIIIVKSFYLPQLQITGLCFAEDVLFTCDITKNAICKHRMDNWLTVTDIIQSSGTSISAIFWDGKYFWSADSMNGKIYKNLMTPSFHAVENFDAPGKTIVGIYTDEKFLWFVDSDNGKIYQHLIDHNMTMVKNYAISDLLEDQGSVSAFTVYDQNIWITKEGINKIYRIPIKQLEKQ